MPVPLGRVPAAERDVAEATFQALGRALAVAQFEELTVPAYAISPAFWTLLAGDHMDASQDLFQLCRRLMDCDPLFFQACLHELSRAGSGPSASDMLHRIQQHLQQSPIVPLDSIARIREGMMEVLRAAVPPNRVSHLEKAVFALTGTGWERFLCPDVLHGVRFQFGNFPRTVSVVPGMMREVAARMAPRQLLHLVHFVTGRVWPRGPIEVMGESVSVTEPMYVPVANQATSTLLLSQHFESAEQLQRQLFVALSNASPAFAAATQLNYGQWRLSVPVYAYVCA